MLANFLGLNLKVSYISKKNFGLRSRTPFFTYFHSLRQFHVTIQKRRLRNKQESVMHVQSCFFAKINLLLFCRSRCCRRRRCLSSLLLSSKNFTTMVTWRHTSLLLKNASDPKVGHLFEHLQCWDQLSTAHILKEYSIILPFISFWTWRYRLLYSQKNSVDAIAMFAIKKYHDGWRRDMV